MASSTTAKTPAPAGPEAGVDDPGTDRMRNVVVAVTGIRCVLMYMVLPAAGVIGTGISGVWLPGAGVISSEYSTPVLSLSLFLHLVTLVTTTIAVRRAFRSGHRLRWPYAALGSTFFLFSALSILLEGALLAG